MTSVVYDGSFEGLLTAIFEVYEYKFRDCQITTSNRYQPSAFHKLHSSVMDEAKANRVWNGLIAKISRNALGQFYRAFLSEKKDMENTLLLYVQKVFANKQTVEYNFADPCVMQVVDTAKKVYREKHRMEAFIRFQLTKDNLYYAICQPDFNVLPLIEKHFKDRYADQRWLIYDSTRRYGLYYDLDSVSNVEIDFAEDVAMHPVSILHEDEMLYQELWKQYFSSVNIAARKNIQLHIKHMPKRYWRFLTEKQVG